MLDNVTVPLEVWHLISLSIGCFNLLLLVCLLCFQVHRRVKLRRQQRVTDRWRPRLEHAATDPTTALPSLTRRDHIVLLYLWNECYEATPEPTTGHLVRLAQRVGTNRFTKELLKAQLLRRRILAVITLGRLRDRSAWFSICAFLPHQNAFLSFSAAQALLRIDAEAALPLLRPLIGHRADWSPLRIASMLNAVGPALASDTLAQAAITGNAIVGPRLIRYLPITHHTSGLSILRRFVDEHRPSDNMLAACLFVFGEFRDQQDLNRVRQYLAHEAWYVRVQAATALGKLGTVEDEERLIALFHDDQWWVRYRAGEALVSLESMTEEKLLRLQESLASPDAQEILAPILAKFRARRSPIAVSP
jgi:hypothetical protein